MHSFLIAAFFVLMVLSPCLAAQCEDGFPLKLRGRRDRKPVLDPYADTKILALDHNGIPTPDRRAVARPQNSKA